MLDTSETKTTISVNAIVRPVPLPGNPAGLDRHGDAVRGGLLSYVLSEHEGKRY